MQKSGLLPDRIERAETVPASVNDLMACYVAYREDKSLNHARIEQSALALVKVLQYGMRLHDEFQAAARGLSKLLHGRTYRAQ